MLPKYDQNKDGKLDKKEIRRVIGALTMEQFRNMHQQMQIDQKADQKAREKRYDVDGDGKLNEAERKRMQEDRKTGVQVPPQEE
jgi:Ca2+-binding EF-hand superfamily protein